MSIIEADVHLRLSSYIFRTRVCLRKKHPVVMCPSRVARILPLFFFCRVTNSLVLQQTLLAFPYDRDVPDRQIFIRKTSLLLYSSRFPDLYWISLA